MSFWDSSRSTVSNAAALVPLAAGQHHVACTIALKTFALLCPVQVPAYWVAQLQMEMLASGTHSIVLLSRSATKVTQIVCLAGPPRTGAGV